jgi:putative transposase
MVSAQVRRQQVGYARERGLSLRRACALLSVARSAVGYVSKLIAKDAPVVAAMSELGAIYPRFGYRRIAVFLERRGMFMSLDRAYRSNCPVHGIWCRPAA